MLTDLLQTYGQLLLFAFFASLALSYVLTPPVMSLCRVLKIMDEPNDRRIHTKPTPRCGGLAVFAAFSGTLLLLISVVNFPQINEATREFVTRVLPVTLPLIVLGMVDDRWEISPLVKLLGQLTVAGLAWASGMQIGKFMGNEMHLALDVSLTVLLYLGAMNAYNLIDGMDGVAGGLAAITSLGLCGLNVVVGNEGMAAISLAVTGACLGFLRYNFHPARIFLGDTGSLYIGFILMSLTLGSQSRATATVLFIIPLLTMGVPMIDTGLAIWRRSVRKAIYPERKGKVSRADKDHLHHRLARKGLTQRRVALLLYAIQASVFIIGLSWVFLQNYRIAIFTVAFFVGSYVVLRYLASLEMTDSGRWIVDGIRRPGRLQLYNSCMPFLDVLFLSGSLALLAWLLSADFKLLGLNRLIQETAAPVIGVPMIFIWATRYYRLQWTRARAVDFFYFGLVAFAGVAIGVAISPLPLQHSLRHTLLFTLVILSLSIPFLLFLRIFPRLVQDMLHLYERQHSTPEQKGNRVLIYGAGYGFTLITRAESFEGTQSRRHYRLVGLIDDDPNLKERVIHGHPVLGIGMDLVELCIEHEIDEIIVSTTLQPHSLEHLMEVSDQLDLKVSQSQFANKILRERHAPALKGEVELALEP